ncbi:putative 3-hydroxyacyl-CoA dehydrogenase [Paenibacillus baekrokdamisoli]|uniref:Putative 3-hydroxyacyl-CoA dehydrogenase n=1 Tax=Paenibacillus baekrokdamisoli TaxID=1712516 RepID=A0A3G9IWS4_9BACL|nr:3-hydroxyacyl-CoA dehydrogenase/enoyl-CoA hydratase family protein [Paenibacillus baekrokdamisoli]MBB3068215.1 3-hydroxyacyl-CoA dehydrogenase [Paenibacillus baekrokdamisoli]BBH22742.1 putative 3-hydroxyacyl-CoA dehydrogenase [Paenibacillus baekrokdamisoli]
MRAITSLTPIRRAAVIGSGVMGAGIAAHLANAGLQVLLLDVPPDSLTASELQSGWNLDDPKVRNRLAAGSLARLAVQQPPALYEASFLQRITPGNLADDLHRLREVDWIVEAVIERLDVKRQVLTLIESVRREDTLVSTNTSGLSVAAMAEGRGEAFRKHFVATHFFNPPRHMKLVELVAGPDTDPGVLARLTNICEKQLAKGVVVAKDTPNFIANRIGSYGMLVTIEAMRKYGLTVDEVDALTGPAMGRPKTATFRMLDMIGLDTLLHVIDNVRERSQDAAEREAFARPPELEVLVERKWLGEKTGQGFYRKIKRIGGGSDIETLNLQTMTYEPRRSVGSPIIEASKAAKGAGAKLKALLFTDTNDRYANFAWSTIKDILLYSARQLGVIADTTQDIDRAMVWGFNWELGPFELWDALGVKRSVQRMQAEGDTVPEWVEAWLAAGNSSFYKTEGERRFYTYRGEYVEQEVAPEHLSLGSMKEAGKKILGNSGATLIDIGGEVACLEFHSPNNAIGGDILAAIRQSADEVSLNWRGLVIANEGRHFCVGANLMMLLMEAQNGDFDDIDDIIRLFQDSMLKLKRLDRPVVAAPHKMTLGGGVEACLPADCIVFSAETYYGLVETGVGLIPAGGGCKEAAALAAERAGAGGDVLPQLIPLFETIAMAKTSTSGFDVKRIGLMRTQDRAIIRGESRIAEAKRAVLELDRWGYSPPSSAARIRVAGREGRAVLQLAVEAMRLGGQISDHDVRIARKLAHVLAGGDAPAGAEVSEQYLLDLEREAFLSLCGESLTQARMRHLLATGKPLRN